MKFELRDAAGADVFGAQISEENVYISTYGTIVEGCKAPCDLAVGETTRKRYALSGQKPTVYTIVRVS